MNLEGENGIVADLRTLNKGRPGDTYDIFFEKLGAEIEEVPSLETWKCCFI